MKITIGCRNVHYKATVTGEGGSTTVRFDRHHTRKQSLRRVFRILLESKEGDERFLDFYRAVFKIKK